jgi:hypothetical protein
VRLRDDQVVTVRELFECVLQKVLRARVKSCLHAEERDGEGVLEAVRSVRDGSQVVDLLNDALDLGVVTVDL